MWESSPNDLDLPDSHVIDRTVYFDDEIFDEEMGKIFKRTWQYAGHESQLQKTGDYLTVDIYDQPVVVTRNKAGDLSAFYNNCTHRGAAIAIGNKGNCGNGFRCMYHGWSFNLDGKLTGIPRPSHYGKDFDRRKYDIPKVRVESFEGFVFVCLDDKIAPLEEYLGTMGEQIRETSSGVEVIGHVRSRLNGNWKLWPENFRDGYHPEYTHPLVGAVYDGVDQSAGTIGHLPLGHGRLWWPMEGDPRNIEIQKDKLLGEEGSTFDSPMTRARPPIEVDFSRGNTILTIFPNMDIQHLMAGMEHVLQVTRPISPESSVVDCWVLAPKGESDEARKWRLEKNMDAQSMSGKVSGDDAEAMARITKSIRISTIPHTPFARGDGEGDQGQKTEDHALRGFYNAWRTYMGAE